MKNTDTSTTDLTGTPSTPWAVTRVLRDRNAALCLSTVVISGFGTSALWLAAGVWVKDLTGSDGLAALCMLAMWAPTLAGPLLGALADRLRRGPLLTGANLLMAALLPVLTAVDGPDRVWLVFAVLFVYGAAGVVHDAAESAVIATAVDTALLGDVNGLRMTAAEGMKLLAPLAGAGLYSAYGGPAVALLDAATFVLAAALCLGLRVREDTPTPARNDGESRDEGDDGDDHRGTHQGVPGRQGVTEGVRHLRSHALLRPLVLAGGGTMLCAGLAGALVYAVVDALGRPPAFAGVLYAAQGAGSVAVGLLSGPAMRRLGERRFAALGIAVLAVAVASRAVPSTAVAVVCGVAIGAGLPAVLIAALTAVQRETPGALLGRVTATANTLVFTPNVLGLAAGAALVELVDHRLLLVAVGVALLLTAAALRPGPARASRAAARPPSDADPA